MSAVIDFPMKPETRPYLNAFTERATEPQWLRQARRANLNRFAEVGFPSRRSENWRYLDLRPLEQHPFPATCISSEFSGGAAALPEGVWLDSMPRALAERPELARAAVEDVDAAQPLGALNAALFSDGFVLDVAPGLALAPAIEIAHRAPDGVDASLHTRNLINLRAGSHATVVETYAGESGRYWRNDVVAVRLADGAHLTRIVLIEEGAEAIHTALTDVHVGAGARFEEFVLLLGGSRVRHEANICLAGQGASCDINGAYIVAGNDEANIVTAIDHAAPGGRTSELIKGVAADRGHGAFQGRIVVRPHAQQTDARQMSRNLLLGRRAVIDTKPELEIEADDVKCAHGASVGDLDEASLFYLRARGIPADEARRMLVEGFLREPVEAVADAAIRDHLLQRLGARLVTLEG